MPKSFKNVSGRDVIVPALGGRLVIAGAEVEFEDDAAAGLKGQEVNWRPVVKRKPAKKTAAKKVAAKPEPEAASDENPKENG